MPLPKDLLLVDNDERLVELVGWFLEKRGHRVRQAHSFRAARILMTERVPDLLLSDVDLGVENGREELPKLAAEGALPPTLVVSGYLDADLVGELEAIPNVLGCLAKPYDLETLAERIDAIEPGDAVAKPSIDEEAVDDDGWIEIFPQAP